MLNGEILESTDTHRLRVFVDDAPEDPRTEYDNLCHVVTVPGSRYLDVDKDGGPLAHAWRHYLSRHPYDRGLAGRLFTRYARLVHGATLRVHSPYEGPTSVWYLMPEDIEREGITDPMACIKGEIHDYQAWVEGDVYVYLIEQRVEWVRADGTDGTMATWEAVDSCCGFYGYDYAIEAAREAWQAYTPDPDAGQPATVQPATRRTDDNG